MNSGRGLLTVRPAHAELLFYNFEGSFRWSRSDLPSFMATVLANANYSQLHLVLIMWTRLLTTPAHLYNHVGWLKM